MSNTDLEDDLRGTLDRAAASVPPATGLSDRAANGARQARRRTWMVSGAAAVAVAAVAVTGFTLTGGNTAEQPPVAGGAPQSAAPTTAAVQPLSAKTVAGTWRAIQITGAKSLKSARPDDPVLVFKADGTWSGSDGCNGIGGTFTIGQRGEFAAKIGPQHLIGCDNVPHTGVLASAKRIEVAEDTLTFAAGDGKELARYARAG